MIEVFNGPGPRQDQDQSPQFRAGTKAGKRQGETAAFVELIHLNDLLDDVTSLFHQYFAIILSK